MKETEVVAERSGWAELVVARSERDDHRDVGGLTTDHGDVHSVGSEADVSSAQAGVLVLVDAEQVEEDEQVGTPVSWKHSKTWRWHFLT